MKPRSSLLAFLPCLLAGACGGATNVDAIGRPASAEVPAPGAAQPAPANVIDPPPATGPYDGAVATTDVSLLYPVHVASTLADFVRPTALGNFGALLPRGAFDAVTGGRALASVTHPTASGYDHLGLVSIRIDHCSARGGAGCRPEVRLVFQPLYEDAAVGAGATDGAVHAIYDVPDAELVEMLQQILTAKKANGGAARIELAPHPILEAQGIGGSFGQALRAIVLSHVGDTRLARITTFDHNMTFDSDGWIFAIADRSGASFVPGSIPGQGEKTQILVGTATDVELAHSGAFPFGDAAAKDAVFALADQARPAPGSAQATALKAVFDAALRVENPTLHTAESTDCVNCHLAEGAKLVGKKLYGFTSQSAFTHPRGNAYVSERTSVTNVHAFGYLHRQPAIMQRTANESVLVAAEMEKRLP